MKRALALLLAAALFCLSGCSLTPASMESLLSPPVRTEEQSEIYQALLGSVNANISLVYPRSGEYTSAFVVEDIDGDGLEDALVFYRDQSQATSTGSVRMNFLVQRDGNWVSTHDISLQNATEVEKMQLIHQDGTTYLVVGFNQSSTSEKLLKVYTYSQEQGPQERLSENCSNFTVTDLDGDGIHDLFLISAPPVSDNMTREVTGILWKLQNGKFVEDSTVRMNSRAMEYLNINLGWVEQEDIPALYLDSQIGTNSEGTEIIRYQNGQLVDLMVSANAEEDRAAVTYRPSGYSCLDLDQNGCYEIPSPQLFPGYTDQDSTQSLFYIVWSVYQQGDLVPTAITYTNYLLNYHFYLPDPWVGEVSASWDSTTNEITFFRYQDSLRQQEQVLLKIRVFTRSDWEGRSPASHYVYLAQNGQLVYSYELFETGSGLDLTDQEVQQRFTLMNS